MINEKFDKTINVILQQTHPNIFNKVNTDSVGKWKTELTFEEQDQISSILHDSGEKYGYQRNENYTGNKFRIKSMIGFFINMRDILIIKSYFLLPFIIRKAIKKCSRFIFERTGFFTVYNEVDLLFDVYKKKQE